MKIIFEDKSYIEIKKDNDKVMVIIQAKDVENPRKNIINVCELTNEQFKAIYEEISNKSS